MRAAVAWMLKNAPAANTLVVAVLFVGAFSLASLQRERFPDFRPDKIVIRVDYPGASPSETERSIALKVEEAIRAIVGIRKLTSVSKEGSSTTTAELEPWVRKPDQVLNEVRSAIDRIPTFPKEIERPIVRLDVRLRNVISVAVLGPERTDASSELQLRGIAESIREDLLALPAVSHVHLWHAKPFQIDVELSHRELTRFGLTHRDVTEAIRQANVDIPAGDVRTPGNDFLLRVDNKTRSGAGIGEIPVKTTTDGTVIRVKDLANVRDAFADIDIFARMNGRPALSMQIHRSSEEDLVEIHRQVADYLADASVPVGYDLVLWDDYSRQARDRIALLSENALVGLLLVFAVLATFLDLRLAFWVAVGIPVSVLGTCIVMLVCGATLNMHSMFALVMALGIVVDDAIVVSENIYRHRQAGASAWRSAVDGTVEVAPAVVSSVLTTVIAFVPLTMVEGQMGKWIAVIPLAVISMLLISLLEGLFILPCHLAHLPAAERTGPVIAFQRSVQSAVDFVIDRLYVPILRWSINHVGTVLATSAAVALVLIGLYLGGYTPLVVNQKLDYAFLYTYIEYPNGTPTQTIDNATKRLSTTLNRVANQQDYERPLLTMTYRGVGYTDQLDNKRGEVYAELDRSLAFDQASSRKLISDWRNHAGEFPGASRVIFWGVNNSPGGKAIELSLLSSDVEQLETVATAIKEKLRGYQGVSDIADSRGPGKWEQRFKLTPEAEAKGLRLAQLGDSLRAAYFGDEVMRLQRGRHEVKVMVRYSERERQTLASLDTLELPGGTANRTTIPVAAAAQRTVARGHAQILRIDQQRAITITAEVDESIVAATEVAADLDANFLPPLLRDNASVELRWEGKQRETRRSLASLSVGLAIALFGMYGLLTLVFRSYWQPLIVIAVIPLGFVGAIVGHLVLQQPITLFSLFGLVTLSGVVANDSIVLIDFINRRRAEVDFQQVLLDSGRLRFRAVMLTTITTVAALLPLLLERNTQAQVLIPMAVSIACGLLLATVWILVLVPVLYKVGEDLRLRVWETNTEAQGTPS